MKYLLLGFLTLTGSASFSQTHSDSILINLTNIERAKYGLGQVVYLSQLDSAAEFHNRYQVKYEKLTHIEDKIMPGEPTYYSSVSQRIYRFRNISTNKIDLDPNGNSEIASQYMSTDLGLMSASQAIIDAEVEVIFKGWLNSKPHREALLNPLATHIAFSTNMNIIPAKSFAGQLISIRATGVIGRAFLIK